MTEWQSWAEAELPWSWEGKIFHLLWRLFPWCLVTVGSYIAEAAAFQQESTLGSISNVCHESWNGEKWLVCCASCHL